MFRCLFCITFLVATCVRTGSIWGLADRDLISVGVGIAYSSSSMLLLCQLALCWGTVSTVMRTIVVVVIFAFPVKFRIYSCVARHINS